MLTDSYIEMFTSIYGWLMYNTLWDVFTQTGLVFLPFFGIIVDNLVDSFKEGPSHEGIAEGSLRALEVDVIMALLVVSIAGNPVVRLTAESVQFHPPDDFMGNPQASVNATDTTHTTYGAVAFTNLPNDVEVPLWWMGVIQLSKAVTHTIRQQPALLRTLDYREYVQQLSLVDVDDPRVRQETNDFFRDCYIPTRSKYYQHLPQATDAEIIAYDRILSTYGNNDPDYIGSRLYLDVDGFYNALRPLEQRPGFPFDPLRDREWEDGVDVRPTWGRPTCSQWWLGESGGDIGLKARLVSELNSFLQMSARFDPFTDESVVHDRMIRVLLSADRDIAQWTPRDYDYAYDNTSETADDFSRSYLIPLIKNVTGTAALSVLNFIFTMFLDVYLKASHFIQSFLLMMIYGLLPIALLVSRYRLGLLMSVAMIMFSIHFWTALWAWAGFFDSAITKAMYPASGYLTENFLFDGNIQNTLILNFVGSMSYFVLPAVLTFMFAIAGFKMGSSINGLAEGYKSEVKGAARSTAGAAARRGGNKANNNNKTKGKDKGKKN